MSRAPTSKNLKDKKGGQATSTPVVAHEIITGKLTDHDWTNMIEKDESEELIIDFRNELLDSVMNHIYLLYIEQQLLPYTISLAKDALVQIVEWRFLTYDVGEEDTDTSESWMPDEEPLPMTTDCWAQGSVPKMVVNKVITPTPTILEEQTVESEITDIPTVEENYSTISYMDVTEIPEVVEEQAVITKGPPSTFLPYQGKSKNYKRRHFGPLKSAGVSRMTETLEQTEQELFRQQHESKQVVNMRRIVPEMVNMPSSCHSLIKVQQNRSGLEKDIKFDEYGNVTSVLKLDPRKLPSHCVRVRYHIRDPAEDDKEKRIKELTAGRYRMKKSNKGEPVQIIDRSSCVSRHTQVVTPTSQLGRGCQKNLTNLPSSLIENIELSPGVVVREGDMVRRGPPRKQRIKVKVDDNPSELRIIPPPNNWKTHEGINILESASVVTQLNDVPIIPPIIRPSPPLPSQLT